MEEIKGYRDLTLQEIALINEVKTQANIIGVSIESFKHMPLLVDQRWLAIGETHLQQGFMALVRAISKPDGF